METSKIKSILYYLDSFEVLYLISFLKNASLFAQCLTVSKLMIFLQFILELIYSGVPHVVLTIYEDDSKARSKGNIEPRNLGPGPWL